MSYPGYRDPGRIPIDWLTRLAILRQIAHHDVLIARRLGQETRIARQVAQRWLDFVPDVIQLEQPWCWPMVRRLLREEILPPVRIVYSSHGVEMLKECWAESSFVGEIERDLLQHAAIVVTRSATEATIFKELGAQATLSVATPVEATTPSDWALARWKGRLLPSGVRAFAVAVIRDPMSQADFEQLFGTTLEYLPPRTRLVVCGPVAQSLAQCPRFFHRDSVNRDRLVLLESPIEDSLAAIRKLAQVVVLPFAESRIETIEALHAGRAIVATKETLVDEEEIAKRGGIVQCEKPREFRLALRDALLRQTQQTFPIPLGANRDCQSMADQLVRGINQAFSRGSGI